MLFVTLLCFSFIEGKVFAQELIPLYSSAISNRIGFFMEFPALTVLLLGCLLCLENYLPSKSLSMAGKCRDFTTVPDW